MICALFDLQYILNDVWDTLKLNKMDKDMGEFFRIIDYIDEAMHGGCVGVYDKNKDDYVVRKKKKNEYLVEEPKWQKIK